MKRISILIVVLITEMAFGMGSRNGGADQPDSPNWLSRRFDGVTNDDLARIRDRYREEACFNQQGLQVSCGERSEWDNGDPTYDWDPYLGGIPRGTPVDVDINCDPNTGRFYMNIRVHLRVCSRGSNGEIDQSTCRTETKYFHNPYEARENFLSSTPNRWVTSPGLFNPNLSPNSATTLPSGRIRSDRAVVTEYHRVSSAQPWDGAPMFHAVWVRGGIAIHGSDSVDGHARSGGCIRLSQRNAMAFFRLARRVGTNNIHYNWGGYGPGNPPACATPPEVHAQVINARNSQTREDRDQAVAELEEALQRQMQREGRTRGNPAFAEPEEQRAVQSVDEKTKAHGHPHPGLWQKFKNFWNKFF